MPLVFYPHLEDVSNGSLEDRIEVLMDAADRYKAVVLGGQVTPADPNKRLVPRELAVAFNWEEIAHALREIRDLPESNPIDKTRKGNLLAKLAEVYEVLRAAKMSKLEAVRLALMSESKQLLGKSM
jgi:hypothetical protein